MFSQNAKFIYDVSSSNISHIHNNNLANDVEDSTEFEFENAIYYGDSVVNLDERFSITCIIPITDRIFWLKDDEPITRHNLRHGRDGHSYVLSESAIEGEFRKKNKTTHIQKKPTTYFLAKINRKKMLGHIYVRVWNIRKEGTFLSFLFPFLWKKGSKFFYYYRN